MTCSLVVNSKSGNTRMVSGAIKRTLQAAGVEFVHAAALSDDADADQVALEAQGASFVYGTEQVEGAYDVCVTCPGISEFSAFFKAGREHATQIMGEPEFAYRLSPQNWIAITGTNGKTTTTSLTDYLLKAAGEASVAVGNIGEPPVNEIDGRAHNEWFVAELSSYQIATTAELHPRVAVLLNITPDHIEWHGTMEAYAAAKEKIFANMGQAYVADGKMEKAVRAFESALADKTYVFNDAANVDYQRAVAAVAAGNTGEVEAVTPEEVSSASTHNDLSGLDVQGDGVPIESSRLDPSEMGTMQLSETSIMREIAAAEQAGSQYFQEAEQDFQDWGQPLKKKRRHRGLKAFLIILILIIIVAGGGAFAYTQGYGMPSQQDQVNALFADPQNADVYAASVDESKKARIADTVTQGGQVTINGTTNNLGTAEVYATATISQGGEVPYQISMVRDGLGWKVSSVSLSFTSQS